MGEAEGSDRGVVKKSARMGAATSKGMGVSHGQDCEGAPKQGHGDEGEGMGTADGGGVVAEAVVDWMEIRGFF